MHIDKTLSEKAHMNNNNIDGNNSNSNINDSLFQFMEEFIWDIISRLEERCCDHRYVGYLELMAIVTTKDAEALDKAASTGYALSLAEQLVGARCFWETMAARIRHSIELDAQEGDLEKAEAKKLLGLLQAAL
jgi:hypothetical protein